MSAKYYELPRSVATGPISTDNVLRAYGTAISATTSSTGIAMTIREGFYTRVRIEHDATASVDGSNYWTFTVEVSDVVGGTYTQVGQSAQIASTAAGTFDIPLFGPNVAVIDADSAFIRVTATKTLSPGNLDFSAVMLYEEC